MKHAVFNTNILIASKYFAKRFAIRKECLERINVPWIVKFVFSFRLMWQI